MRTSRLTTYRLLLAAGFILLLLTIITTVTAYDSCSAGYYIYSTSDGQCCREGFPYFYEGSCHPCNYGSVYDSYSGNCCPWDTPQYYDGACHTCREGFRLYSTSEGQCCPEGYPYYYNGQCHAQAESTSPSTDVTISSVNIPAEFSTVPTPAPVVIVVNVPPSPTKAPVAPFLPVIGIGMICVIWGIARKNK